MAEESYVKRLDAALDAQMASVARRDGFYPGSPEWESEHAKVQEWERVIVDLRRANERGWEAT